MNFGKSHEPENLTILLNFHLVPSPWPLPRNFLILSSSYSKIMLSIPDQMTWALVAAITFSLHPRPSLLMWGEGAQLIHHLESCCFSFCMHFLKTHISGIFSYHQNEYLPVFFYMVPNKAIKIFYFLRLGTLAVIYYLNVLIKIITFNIVMLFAIYHQNSHQGYPKCSLINHEFPTSFRAVLPTIHTKFHLN